MEICATLLLDEFFNMDNIQIIRYLLEYIFNMNSKFVYLLPGLRNTFYGINTCQDSEWLTKYNDEIFYRFFRIKRSTFDRLLNVLLENDNFHLIKKKYRGGNFPVRPEKSLLIFLWYMAQEDSLQCVGHTFKVTASTVMQIVNVFLYILLQIKNKYIFWPRNQEEFAHVSHGFQNYPDTIGAIDGSHIELKVPKEQQDSYIDRFQGHSINLLGICTSNKILTYVFVGFPGSAHDSRVFLNSGFMRNITRYGPNFYFPNPDYHLIGDSAFPIRTWLMTPFRRNNNMNRMEKYHNNCLSRDRVVIENVFGLVKGRWRRLLYINTYSVSKAVEIATAACILHNFSYCNNDVWFDEIIHHEEPPHQIFAENNPEEARRGQEKRNMIARYLINNHV